MRPSNVFIAVAATIALCSTFAWIGVLDPPYEYKYKGYGTFDLDTAMRIASEHKDNSCVVQANGDVWYVAYHWTDREEGKYGLDSERDRSLAIFLWAVFFIGFCAMCLMWRETLRR